MLDANGVPVIEGARDGDWFCGNDADARLIAAAPELLDALKSALHRERQLAGVIGAVCTGSVHEAAAALIARIEGEPSVSSSSTPSATPP
jgi:hypothetical protein